MGGDGAAEGVMLQTQTWYWPDQIVSAADPQDWTPHWTAAPQDWTPHRTETTVMVKAEDRSTFTGG